MSVLNENQLLGASGAGGDYEIEQSLRFDDGRGSYLSRTPSSAGNRKTWTWSGWVKRGNLGSSTYYCFYGVDGVSPNDRTEFVFTADAFEIYEEVSSTAKISLKTTQLFRDPSAWYHVVIAMDTTQATNTNRVKFYVNGEQVTSFSASTYPSLNYDTFTNSAKVHVLGARRYADGTTNKFLDGYLAEVNLIDGQALTPDSFGETGTYGEWKPIAYAGTYGTNGFYLPFKQDYTVEGFSTVTYEGNGATQYIGGTGFQPDLVWIKRRDGATGHRLFDSSRGFDSGSGRYLQSDTNSAELTTPDFDSFDSDGFTVSGSGNSTNANGNTFVAWNWDMGGTTASNTSGTITSSVRANTTYGQSIVSYTGNSTTGATVGHGLASAPTMIIVKRRTAVNSWITYHGSLGATKMSLLDQTTATSTTSAPWNNTEPTSSVFTIDGIGPYTPVNNSGNTYIAYCFHDVANYSKFGSYTGNGSATGPVVTTGFTPAFVMTKNTASAYRWYMLDNTRDPSNPVYKRLFANNSDAESTNQNTIEFTSTGFNIITSDAEINQSGTTMIYAAFADTREYAYWLDQSGNNNDWTSEGGLTESDVMVDSPTNNFCTFNPLDVTNGTLQEGNTEFIYTSTSQGGAIRSTVAAASGKWYCEILLQAYGGNNPMCGIVGSSADFGGSGDSYVGKFVNGYAYNLGDGTGTAGYKFNNAASAAYGASTIAGDIVGIVADLDVGSITFYKNNVSQGVAYSGVSSQSFHFSVSSLFSSIMILNAGQDSSFAGNKTAQGNSDSNGIGDFYYAPPAGFLALCTQNLPDATVIPSEHFNTVIYTGNSTDGRSITGTGFAPEMVWTKARSAAYDGSVYDIIRGAGAAGHLTTSTTEAEGTGNWVFGHISSFDSDGVTLSAGSDAGNPYANENESGKTYVSWNWKAGGTAVSNTNGSITSSVSANPSAGFSIVSYTGTSAASATIGHSLSQKPELIMVKKRDEVGNWIVFTETTGKDNKLNLNETTASATSALFNNVAPTSTVFSVKDTSTDDTFGVGHTYIAYCFHSVDSYSKVGSYIGNGNVDGPFVNCGFKPAYILAKVASSQLNAAGWQIYDTARGTFNPVDDYLFADSSGAESASAATYFAADILSNGFKIRAANTYGMNQSGATYIFLAFAESPFKHTNAR